VYGLVPKVSAMSYVYSPLSWASLLQINPTNKNNPKAIFFILIIKQILTGHQYTPLNYKPPAYGPNGLVSFAIRWRCLTPSATPPPKAASHRKAPWRRPLLSLSTCRSWLRSAMQGAVPGSLLGFEVQGKPPGDHMVSFSLLHFILLAPQPLPYRTR